MSHKPRPDAPSSYVVRDRGSRGRRGSFRDFGACERTGRMMSLMACSGPHALEHIHTNIGISLALFGLAVASALGPLARFTTSRRRLGRFVSVVVLAGFHPGWWMPAYSGDCGQMRLVSSALATITCAFLAAPLWRRPQGTSPRTLDV
jgi:hypothetical protein